MNGILEKSQQNLTKFFANKQYQAYAVRFEDSVRAFESLLEEEKERNKRSIQRLFTAG